MSTNARPGEHALEDATLRRTGVRDLSGETKREQSVGPPNPRTDIFDPQTSGRSAVPHLDYLLHMGRPPERIDRMNSMRMFGDISPRGQGGYNPRNAGEYMIVGHVPAAHLVKQPASGIPFHGSADNLHIPSTKIGNPL
jgi:hypothetical protein